MFKEKLIYVCSPLKGDIKTNIAKAKECCKSVRMAGYFPFAPHVELEGAFDDNKPEERKDALDLGLLILKHCDELWVFGKVISEGMKVEIDRARELKISVKYVIYD